MEEKEVIKKEVNNKEIEEKEGLKDSVVEKDADQKDTIEQAWIKKRNIWLVGLAVTFVLGIVILELINLFFLWLMFGGAYIYFSRQIDDNGKPRLYRKELTLKEEERTIIVYLPWYHTVHGILIIGVFTAGIYWFVGPFLRMGWMGKKKQEAREV